jgi:glycerophosphoryl diester phosphodiesterase
MGSVHRLALAALFLLIGGDVMAFDIEAHRGGRALLPENTLASFANALSLGVDTLELDIGVTRDGVIVVSHERGLNPDLAQGPDGKYVASPGTPFVRLTLEEVKQFDVGQIRPGSRYAAQFPDQRAVPQTRIPTLKEVIDLVRKSGDRQVRLNIETKIDPGHPQESPGPDRFVELLLDLLRAEEFESRVMVQSFDWRTLQLVQRLAAGMPDCPVGVGADGLARRRNGVDRRLQSRRTWPIASAHDQGRGRCDLVAHLGDVTPALISESHALGLQVVVWTVNKPADMARMIELGVDGIISDRPDLLRQVAASKGIALPKGSPVTP